MKRTEVEKDGRMWYLERVAVKGMKGSHNKIILSETDSA